jgi:hypothetical protein
VATLDVAAVERISPRDLVRGRWARLDIGNVDPRRLLRGEAGDVRIGARSFRSGRDADLVGTTHAVLLLVSERFRETLTGLGMTGWSTRPVDLDGSLPGDLELLVVTGRCGPIHSAARDPLPDLPAFGAFVDPRSWDGSDVFLANGSSEVLIAPDRAAALRLARLRNVLLEPAALEPWTVPG